MGSGADRAKLFFQKIEELTAADPQFAAAVPDQEVVAAVSDPTLSFTRYLDTLMRGYADRPALAHRVGDGYATISYGELWSRVGAIAAAWSADGLEPGDFVATIGFTSPDYTALDLAATRSGLVSVPLQAGASVAQLSAILEETAPKVFAASAESLEGAVDCVLRTPSVQRLVIFDLRDDSPEHRAALAAAKAKLAQPQNPEQARGPVAVETLDELVARGAALPEPPVFEPAEGEDPLALLIYTSGSTGTPKGAMYSQRLVSRFWPRTPVVAQLPSISLHYMPLSHSYGRAVLCGTLAAGGTAHFTAHSDLSTLFEDIALARPTFLALVPRVCEMLLHESRRARDLAELRERVLGERLLVAVCGSAPLAPETRAFMEELLGFPLLDGYGSTEALSLMRDGVIQRPPVIDYKLVDVPELGYFTTDKPHPRGELLIRSESLVSGYYKRPELTAEMFDEQGYYKTGDVMAEIAPDRLVYVDRSKNVLKLSQGEFVAVAKLEAAFGASPYVKQIFVYGNSERSFLLAVVVPNAELVGRLDTVQALAEVKPLIADSLAAIAKESGLQSYEVPRDFIVETEPFTTGNGLLSEVGKLLRPKLKERYGERLEALYDQIAQGQADELRALREQAGERPVIDTVRKAAAAVVGSSGADFRPDANFADLGGDSLSALGFANLLQDVFGVETPVRIIIGPTASLAGIAEHIERALGGRPGEAAPNSASVHGAGAEVIRASDLTLDKFLDAQALEAAQSLPRPTGSHRTVLLTGANGWLGRFLALEQLQRLEATGGKLICLVRGKDAASARARVEEALGTDPALAARFAELAADRLEVVPGDVGEPKFGLDDRTWDRLAGEVDAVVHSGALVNHVLPYHQLFGSNVVGVAEIIRFAVASKLKPVAYLSTVAVAAGADPAAFDEDGDIREVVPQRPVDDSYANGYGNSKWAGEVLLREAHERTGLPVRVFRSDMILAHRQHTGQLNATDQFTRLILSLLATGLAPKSFYQLDPQGRRQRAHYDGIPVDFTAEAIVALAAEGNNGHRSYNVFNPHHDGVGLDEFVDWLIEAGHPITRIEDHATWFARFTTALRALPEKQRQLSLLPLAQVYSFPHPAVDGSPFRNAVFRADVQRARIGKDHDIPHLTRELILKYAADLAALGLL
ncbi:thioester reductase domain protein [Segniliparus rotundus DSM 44985]|uniref:Carboxylic acid reductase n=1 Tax=Segniliparus rotundus (strain ATCC BAA-972 / CDC 1076 / CIP 108378 / DSM 44985 / JCM 13578) TaxID=640132 RepID=D6ZDT1_SEGRD|nr:carboxylic acid reductase [Segniliparus rotundus]ADG99338.1 thioester reductase domain protein [Segniliparus rotundus DSM 44985]